MGGSQSTVSVTEDSLPAQPPLDSIAKGVLKDFAVLGLESGKTVPGGGRRLYKSYCVRRKPVAGASAAAPPQTASSGEAGGVVVGSGGVVAVLKVAYLQKPQDSSKSSAWLQSLAQELLQIKQATQNLPHVWPCVAWFGPTSFPSTTTSVVSGATAAAISSNSHQPALWLRPYSYTTLGDRLSHRPWLNPAVEKLFLVQQLCLAVQSLHETGLVHGALQTHNIGCTSTGFLVLLDVMPTTFRPRYLPHDDPTEYLYCFSSRQSCCLAPERFDKNVGGNDDERLTPAMDIFSLGCCLVELALNGEPCFDLGQLLEYRRSGSATLLTQKLQKMESSALRAACRHMLNVDPTQRLSSPREYWERLKEQCLTTERSQRIFEDLLYQQLLLPMQSMDTPDARVQHLLQAYSTVLYETMGVALPKKNNQASPETPPVEKRETDKKSEGPISPSDLWSETEALLKELEAMNEGFMAVADSAPKTVDADDDAATAAAAPEKEPRTPFEESCLLIYVQQVLGCLRYVQRPATKVRALTLLHHVSRYVADEVRLQRIVPVLVVLLKDADATVRAAALHTLSGTLSQLTSFPPSDAQVMPRYVFKRVAPLLTDVCLSVRLAVANNMGALAETAQRFLDISQAVRLVQAVEGNASGSQTPVVTPSGRQTENNNIFEEKVTQLLDEAPPRVNKSEGETTAGTTYPNASATGAILVRSTYQTERSALAETLSRWVVHICTDQSENASLVKRALLRHALPGLCNFFSLEGVMAFMLPQLLAFLNDRQDWQLRAALFAGLPLVCRIIGRGATEEFVLPCIEIGLVDNQEQVIAEALSCLARLIEQGLLSRALVVTTGIDRDKTQSSSTILDRYSAFLIHPSTSIRRAAIQAFCSTCRALGSPDGVVYLTPVLRPFVRFQPPSYKYLSSEFEMVKCLKAPWTRKHFREQLGQASVNRNAPWTAVGRIASGAATDLTSTSQPETQHEVDPMVERMQSYLRLLVRHTLQTESPSSRQPDNIEGSLKLAQSVVVPRRHITTCLPEWYNSLRTQLENEDSPISEASAISSVSQLGQVYGLSIMGPTFDAAVPTIEPSDDVARQGSSRSDPGSSALTEQALMGSWRSEVLLEADAVGTSLLVTKLKALQVPSLPPNLGGHAGPGKPRTPKDAPQPAEWKPRMNSMIASSSIIGGHTAPVVRLAVSLDSSFFVSASHDGTCGVWEIPQLEQSSGCLERRTSYSGHCGAGPTRVNDVAMVEGTYSVVTGASNGTVHVWRVDMVSSPSSAAKTTVPSVERRERVRVVGTSSVREAHPAEGEIMAVSHFNSVSNSVVVFGTQKGVVHSWDLRSAEEPFSLRHGPKLGHLSSMALGGDRNWIVTGTSRGYVALWDVRFQQPFRLWRHSGKEKINRLAASFVPPPQTWGTPNSLGGAGSRPYVFVGSKSNECSMFDILSGSCVECFRTVPGDRHSIHAGEDMPYLVDISGRSKLRNGALTVPDEDFSIPRKSFSPSINCMVGSIGGQSNNFLLTGGSDGFIRSWDFSVGSPARSYIISGPSTAQPRPTFERVDFDGARRLIVCRQHFGVGRQFAYGNQGMKRPDFYHTDSIEDLKIVDNNALLSCSRDCTIKVWR